MKRNRSLNTTNGLLVNMESSYVTTCFGLHLWPSSCYNLVPLRVLYNMLNLLQSTSYVMHQQFNNQQLYALPTLYLCVLYLSETKQRLVPLTA